MLLFPVVPAHAQVVQERLLLAAGVDARARYGVANVLDSEVFPLLDGGRGAFVIDTAVAPGLLRITDLACDGGLPCTRPVDMYASSTGFGVSSEYVGVYFASSFNLALPRTEESAIVAFLPFLTPLTTPFLAPFSVGPAGVLGGQSVLLGDGMEWSTGVRLYVPLKGEERLAGSIGYYAAGDRSGAYTTFSDSQLRTVFSSLLTRGVPYLLGGVRESEAPWEGVAQLGARKLASSLYVRKVSLQKANDLLPSGSALAASAPPLWSGHVEQLGLGPLDLHLAVAWKPQVLVHEARAGLVFGGEDGQCGVEGGIVNLPPAPWLTVEGGIQPTASLKCSFLGGMMRASVGMNTPELLTAFPYSHNAVVGQFTIAIGADDEGNLQ